MLEGAPLLVYLSGVIEQILNRLAVNEGGVMSQLVTVRQTYLSGNDNSVLLFVLDARGPDGEWADAREARVTCRVNEALTFL